MKSGYLYVLVHPSDPYLYKIGVTIKKPEQRLAEHNGVYTELTGRIVKETGQKWELKEYIVVPDPYWAEKVFWGATPCGVMPFPGGAEVEKMEWEWIQAGLNAAKKAGVRPPPKPRTRPVRNRESFEQRRDHHATRRAPEVSPNHRPVACCRWPSRIGQGPGHNWPVAAVCG